MKKIYLCLLFLFATATTVSALEISASTMFSNLSIINLGLATPLEIDAYYSVRREIFTESGGNIAFDEDSNINMATATSEANSLVDDYTENNHTLGYSYNFEDNATGSVSAEVEGLGSYASASTEQTIRYQIESTGSDQILDINFDYDLSGSMYSELYDTTGYTEEEGLWLADIRLSVFGTYRGTSYSNSYYDYHSYHLMDNIADATRPTGNHYDITRPLSTGDTATIEITLTSMLFGIGAEDDTALRFIDSPTILDRRNMIPISGIERYFTQNAIDLSTPFAPKPTEPVPEPTTMLLLGIGLIGVTGISRKRKK